MARKMITVIFTCYNRLDKTANCIRSLTEGNPSLNLSFVILDDGSTDGTAELLDGYKKNGMDIQILHGDGNSFWAGGMRKAIAYAKRNADADYYLLVNDDVDFYPGSIEEMICEYESQNKERTGLALVGATCDENGAFTYGGLRYDRGIRYEEVTPEQTDRSCDSFNMNCLLLDKKTFSRTANLDEHYIHSLADFDYGLHMKKLGVVILTAPFYVGVCKKNDPTGTWLDRSLSRRERLKKKESPKGAPLGPWFYFLHKNFGLGQALLHGFTPFFRIILGK